jgi:hypothetical protein
MVVNMALTLKKHTWYLGRYVLCGQTNECKKYYFLQFLVSHGLQQTLLKKL